MGAHINSSRFLNHPWFDLAVAIIERAVLDYRMLAGAGIVKEFNLVYESASLVRSIKDERNGKPFERRVYFPTKTGNRAGHVYARKKSKHWEESEVLALLDFFRPGGALEDWLDWMKSSVSADATRERLLSEARETNRNE